MSKIHSIYFVLGLLVFVTPVIGLPEMVENIVIAAYGVGLMVLSTTITLKDGETK